MMLNMILILSFTGIMVLMFAVIRRGEKLFEDIRRVCACSPGSGRKKHDRGDPGGTAENPGEKKARALAPAASLERADS